MADALKTELATYRRLLPTLLADEGKYVLVIGEELAGVFGTYEDALNEGYKRAHLDPFLVKKISGTEAVAYFSRDLPSPCHI